MCVFRELFCKRNMSWDLREELPAWSKWGTFLSQKKKKKSLVVSGSQTLCKMSWDGDHLDKDIPTPPNKTQVRKQEKHPHTHTELSQDTEWLKGGNFAQCRRKWGSTGTWECRAPGNSGNALHSVLGERKGTDPAECEAREDWPGGKREDSKWRNFHFHSHFPCFLQALKSCPNQQLLTG